MTQPLNVSASQAPKAALSPQIGGGRVIIDIIVFIMARKLSGPPSAGVW